MGLLSSLWENTRARKRIRVFKLGPAAVYANLFMRGGRKPSVSWSGKLWRFTVNSRGRKSFDGPGPTYWQKD